MQFDLSYYVILIFDDKAERMTIGMIKRNNDMNSSSILIYEKRLKLELREHIVF